MAQYTRRRIPGTRRDSLFRRLAMSTGTLKPKAKAKARAKPKVVLGLEIAGALMTPTEFDAFVESEEHDEDYRYELINGVLVVTLYPARTEMGANEMLGYF